jgi:hypothetical protein
MVKKFMLCGPTKYSGFSFKFERTVVKTFKYDWISGEKLTEGEHR